MHPADVAELGLGAGDLVELASARAAIRAVVELDPGLRRGVVSIAHAYGGLPEGDDPRAVGSNTNRLLDVAGGLERITGQAPMSNIAVRVRPVPA
jgi:anaerobic selenocysteine-containing dehydrogenase